MARRIASTSVDHVVLVLCAANEPLAVTVTAVLAGPSDRGTDRRLSVSVGADVYARIAREHLLGLMPEIAPERPEPDAEGNVAIELRVVGPHGIGTTARELRAWVAELCDAEPDDRRLAVTNWLATSVGEPPVRTMWHHLPSLALDVSSIGNVGGHSDDGAPGDEPTEAAVAAVIEYLRDATGDIDDDLGLDLAGEILTAWLEAGSADPDRALELMARDLRPPIPLDGRTDALATAWEVLAADGVDPASIDDGRAIVYRVDGQNGTWHAVIEQRDDDTVTIHSLVPTELPTDRLFETVELLMRMNRDLSIGSFDLDLDSAEFAFRTGVDVGAAEDASVLLRRAIGANGALLDAYLPVIDAFCAGSTVEQCLEMRTTI